MQFHRSVPGIALLAMLLLLAGLTGSRLQADAGPGDETEAEPGSSRELPPVTDGHRPLRANAPVVGFVPPSEPEVYQGFSGAPDFDVVPREDELTFHPCVQCHAQLPLNPQRRKLMSPHPAALNHGDGRLWCLDCHNPDNRSTLKTSYGEEVSFNDAHIICGTCHFEQEKDWHFGAHGKRVSNWQGERTIYSCTHCHNPHDPSIKPRAPEPPPPVRHGLEAMPTVHHAPQPVAAGPETDNVEEPRNDETAAAD